MSDISPPATSLSPLNPSEQEIRASVRRLAGELARPTPLTAAPPESELVRDLGYDSLRMLELIQKLEEMFALPPIPERALMTIVTIKNAEDTLVRLLSEQPRSS